MTVRQLFIFAANVIGRRDDASPSQEGPIFLKEETTTESAPTGKMQSNRCIATTRVAHPGMLRRVGFRLRGEADV
jgi:hypothetical protein